MIRKILKNKFLLTALTSTLLFSSVSTVAFAEPVTTTTSSSVKIGDQLLKPEEGWKRIDSINDTITYEGEWRIDPNPQMYGKGQYHTLNNGDKMKFNFTGTSLRVIDCTYANYSDNIEITIDNSFKTTFSEYTSNLNYSRVVFQKNDLKDTEHSVVIELKDNKDFGVEAIDIDANGELKPYNPDIINTAPNIKVGDQLLEPEEGWKRYDDTDKNITLKVGDWKNVYDDSRFSNSTWAFASSNNSTLKFNFTGSKLRILGITGPDRPDFTIYIDGNPYKATEKYGPIVYGSLISEQLNLKDKEHYVTLTISPNSAPFIFDAIDIDANGELKPYNTDITNNPIVLDVEPEKEKIRIAEEVTADLVIDNINEIAAEDIRIKYDSEKLQYLDCDEVEGMKLVIKNDEQAGELRFIIASKGESNIVNAKEILLKLHFKGIKQGEALVDIISGRVSDGIEMEKDLEEKQCDEATIIIEGLDDVNRSGEFSLLDLAIDARHLNKDPKASELQKYNTDIVVNDAIDEADLLEIGKLMLANPNYTPNK